MRCLAVAYGDGAPSPLQVADAVGQDCRLLWVLDRRGLADDPMTAMLPRLGTVADLTGGVRAEALSELEAQRPEGIVAFADGQLALAGEIAAALGLRFNGPEVTGCFLDKLGQRRRLAAAGIPVPTCVALPGGSPAPVLRRLVEPVRFPAVLKPREGSGSRDTHHLASADRLVELFSGRGPAGTLPEQDYVLEEYLADRTPGGARTFGDYVSVESVVLDARVEHLAVTGKFPLAAPYRETGNFLPSQLARDEIGAVCALAGQAAGALGVTQGCLHTEIKLTPDGPRIIETNARVAGGGIDDLFAMWRGSSLLRVAALAALGVEAAPRGAPVLDGVAYQYFLQSPVEARRLVGLGDLGAVNALAGVEQVLVRRHEGSPLDWRIGSQGYVLSVRGTTPDHAELARIPGLITERLAVEYA